MILVVGATGTLGGMVTRRLLEKGRTVRILVRPNSDAGELEAAGAEPITGDLRDRASLDAACRGVDAVVTTANSAARGGGDNPQTVDLEGNRNLVEAARGAGVKRFVFVSALGVDPDSPVPFFAAKGMTERTLRESGLEYTILAPNLFMEVWIGMMVGMPLQTGQPVTLVGEGRRKHSFVSNRDVAEFAVAVVDHPAAKNQYIPIGGPEALSWREVVATFERVLGRDIPVRTVPPGTPLPGLPETVSQIAAAMDGYDSPVDMTATAATYGVQLTSVEEFARQSAAHAPAHQH